MQPGEAFATVYANDMEKAKEAYGKIVRAYSILPEAPEELPMIKGILH